MTDKEIFAHLGPPSVDSTRPGWKHLVDIAKAEASRRAIDLIQVKQKWGILRIYYEHRNRHVPDDESMRFQVLIQALEKVSAYTCEFCGEPGLGQQYENWYFTACNPCMEKLKNERDKEPSP